jgi:hypothetical protein
VIVFPEGTTAPGDAVLAFQQGAFVAARGLPVEIVPVGIAYPPGSEYLEETFFQHMVRMARRKHTPVCCVVGPSRFLSETSRQRVKRAGDASETHLGPETRGSELPRVSTDARGTPHVVAETAGTPQPSSDARSRPRPALAADVRKSLATAVHAEVQALVHEARRRLESRS